MQGCWGLKAPLVYSLKIRSCSNLQKIGLGASNLVPLKPSFHYFVHICEAVLLVHSQPARCQSLRRTCDVPACKQGMWKCCLAELLCSLRCQQHGPPVHLMYNWFSFVSKIVSLFQESCSVQSTMPYQCSLARCLFLHS